MQPSPVLPEVASIAPVAAHRSPVPAVSWAAIFAGAAAAAALSLILLLLGTGLGLSSVSPWSGQGVSGSSFGVSTILWLSFMQLAASGLGGYLAGRLRTKWIGIHGDESHFRDTAHGLLAWSVATLVTAGMLTSAITTVVAGGAKGAAELAGGVAGTAVTTNAGAAASGSDSMKSTGGNPLQYFADSLFRKGAPATSVTPAIPASSPSGQATSATPGSDTPASAGEVTRILANAVSTGTLPPDDLHYLGGIVSQRAGISEPDAEARVNDTFNRIKTKAQDAENAARDAADKARKASATTSLWLFISLLLGAFVASLMATVGGRQRELSQY